MSEELHDVQQERLIRNYRQINAPLHLVNRIRAEIGARPTPAVSFAPVAAVVTVIIAAVWLLPLLWPAQTTHSPTPSRPSFSALASLSPEKPAVKMPNLAQLRGIETPKMPSKPRRQVEKPQTTIYFKNDDLEEKNHAHT